MSWNRQERTAGHRPTCSCGPENKYNMRRHRRIPSDCRVVSEHEICDNVQFGFALNSDSLIIHRN